VTSIAYREGRVYVSAVEGGRGRILTFDSTGELKQVINLNDLLYGLGLLGIPPNTSAAQFEILVAKFRMQKSLASTR